jgi:hypothetical protein
LYIDERQNEFRVRYYRLKIIDRDGSFTYSPIRSVVFSNAVTFQIYPNPSNGIFHLVYQLNVSEKFEAGLYDLNGRMIKQYKQQATGFLQKLSIDLTDKLYANGMYLLQVEAEGKKTSFKLYKQ